VVDVLAAKTARAARREGVRCVLLSGGVAANGPLRRALGRLPEAGERGLFPGRERPREQRSLIAGLPCGDAYKRRPIAVMLGSDPVARPLSGMNATPASSAR
jgi:hypothetical protein